MDDLSSEVATFLIWLEDLVAKLRGVGQFVNSLEAAEHLVAALQADFSRPASNIQHGGSVGVQSTTTGYTAAPGMAPKGFADSSTPKSTVMQVLLQSISGAKPSLLQTPEDLVALTPKGNNTTVLEKCGLRCGEAHA